MRWEIPRNYGDGKINRLYDERDRLEGERRDYLANRMPDKVGADGIASFDSVTLARYIELGAELADVSRKIRVLEERRGGGADLARV